MLTTVSGNQLVAATLSNYLAKCKAELGNALDGYMDYLRARAYLEGVRVEE